MKYNDTFEKLVMGEFPKNLIRNVYPIAPKQSVYVVAMDEVSEPNRNRGKEWAVFSEKASFRHDIILSFLPGKKERKDGSGFDYHVHHVSIETKRKRKDLLRDNKILQYLGAVDYCFLAVPKDLLSDGVGKICSFEDYKGFVGLINSDNGDIVIMPESQGEIQVRERQDRLLANMHSNPKRFDDPEEVYLPHKFQTGQKPDSFVGKEGLLLNEKYNDLLE